MPVLITVPLMLLVFVLKLHWLPAGGWGGVFDSRIVMPALAISLPGHRRRGPPDAGDDALGVLREDYVRTARAKGLREFTVISRHVARNSLLPLITVIGISLVDLVEGAFFAETLLGIPGIGQFAFESVSGRDYNVILALTLILATTFVIANIVIDIAYTIIDPRVRYERQRALASEAPSPERPRSTLERRARAPGAGDAPSPAQEDRRGRPRLHRRLLLLRRSSPRSSRRTATPTRTWTTSSRARRWRIPSAPTAWAATC